MENHLNFSHNTVTIHVTPPPVPSQIQNQYAKHTHISMSECIYGDVLRRMITFLNCLSVNELGKMNHAWEQSILYKRNVIPWINTKASLLLDNYMRQILFTPENLHAFIDNSKYLQLVRIETQQSSQELRAMIFPSPYIRRFFFSHKEPPSTIERMVTLMPKLQELIIENPNPAELVHLNKLTALKSLTLDDFHATNADIAVLNRLTTLKELYLFGDSQLSHVDLGELTKLRTLSFSVGQQAIHINLERLTALKCLRICNYSHLDPADINLAQLSTLTQLNELTLEESITSAPFIQLKSLTELQKLDLSNCSQITDVALRNLSSFSALQTLCLAKCTQLTDICLQQHLSGLSALRALDLSYTQVTDSGLSFLKNLTALQRLSFQECLKITDDGLIHLSHLKLHSLILVGCSQITDIGLHNIGLVASLEYLDLSESQVDAGLSDLRTFTRLRTLYLRKCIQLTSNSLIHLQALPALRILHLARCPKIDDTSIPYLIKLSALEVLNLSKCPITAPCLSSLREQLPAVQLFLPS